MARHTSVQSAAMTTFLRPVCCTASTTGVSSQKFIVVRSTVVCPGKTACTVYSANRVIMLFTPVGN
jgi:hypothetical protein